MSLKSAALAYAVALVKRFEGCRLTAYKCPAGVWTIGWGATGTGIREGVTWTQAQADDRLAVDLERFMTGVVRAIDARSAKPTPNELGALTSLAYNIGLAAFQASTLLRLYNAGNKSGAAQQFARWNKAGGRVLRGLVTRRDAERKVFEVGEGRQSG